MNLNGKVVNLQRKPTIWKIHFNTSEYTRTSESSASEFSRKLENEFVNE